MNTTDNTPAAAAVTDRANTTDPNTSPADTTTPAGALGSSENSTGAPASAPVTVAPVPLLPMQAHRYTHNEYPDNPERSQLYYVANREAVLLHDLPEDGRLAHIFAASLDLAALARRVARLNPDAGEIGAGMLAQLIDDASIALRKARIPVLDAAERPRRWEDMSAEEKNADTIEKINAMPPGFRGLYKLVWFCRGASMCSTALRLRALLCSLYNGSAARKVDLSEIQHFDGNLRKHFAEVILHLGSSSSGLWDYEIRTAFEKLGLKNYFDQGFPRRRK